MQSQIAGPKKMPQDEDVIPAEYADSDETEEGCGPLLQEAKGQQMYLNNIHGK